MTANPPPPPAGRASGRFYPLVDARCTHLHCNERNAYRMVGYCENCNLNPLLILVSARHEKPHRATCPKCGCDRVRASRLADDDELPLTDAEVADGDAGA